MEVSLVGDITLRKIPISCLLSLLFLCGTVLSRWKSRKAICVFYSCSLIIPLENLNIKREKLN